MQYPYLKNAYLRRQKTYISPYSPGGGIAPEWMPKPPPPQQQQQVAGAPPMRPGSTASAHGYYHPSPPPHAIAPRPAAQFQSPDAFQRGLTQASSSAAAAAPKWEQMLKQLATSTGAPNSNPSTATTPAPPQHQHQQQPQPQYPPLPRASASYGMGPFKLNAPSRPSANIKLGPPLPPTQHPQHPQLRERLKPDEPARPIPSPISDDGKAGGSGKAVVGVGAIDPALTAVPSTVPVAGVGKEAGVEVEVKGIAEGIVGKEVLGGETWRFSAP